MMSGGVMSYTVIDATAHELLGRLLMSITGEPAIFKAKPTYDFLEDADVRYFEVRVQKVLLDALPIRFEVVDKDNSWFVIDLIEDSDEPIEFEIITTH